MNHDKQNIAVLADTSEIRLEAIARVNATVQLQKYHCCNKIVILYTYVWCAELIHAHT